MNKNIEMSGRIKFIAVRHSYGFIRDERNCEYFFSLVNFDRTLVANDEVLFTPGENSKGLTAKNIKKKLGCESG